VKPTLWLEIIILYTVLTLSIAYVIPGESTLFPVRYLFGFVFIFFFPGYCLVNILFRGTNRIDSIETLVLSIALSFGIAGLVGLFLGLSPIGMTFTPLVLTLGTITVALAIIAFVRKTKETRTAQPQPTEQENQKYLEEKMG
jgi:uncharacterized membrane protein